VKVDSQKNKAHLGFQQIAPQTTVHIDEVVLLGFSHIDRYSVAVGIQAELARLFAANGLPRHLSQAQEIESLHGGSFRVAKHGKEHNIAAQVASAVYGGLQ